ncbi:MAG: RnfABCDGE type electron transport complex subunit G [Desulfobacteraceae bacterium]|nr:RnfABCDGE type electron transport complex subunit G [Desulfobacteraceae bacterium]
MRDIIKMIIVLTIIATVMGTALSLVESITREPIEYSRLRFVKGPAVLSVFTDYDNDPIKDFKKDVMLGEDITKSIFPAKKGDKYFAIAFEVTGEGYGGSLGIMIGIDLKSGDLTGLRVITHTETPGLGARVTEPTFYEQFSGLTITDIALSDKGGKVNAISGASISSQGVVEAVKEGLALFDSNKEKIMSSLGAI